MSRKGWKNFFKGASWMFPFYRLVDDGIMKKQDKDREKDKARKLREAIEKALEDAWNSTNTMSLAEGRQEYPETYVLIGTILLENNSIKWDPPWPPAQFEGPYDAGKKQQWQVRLGYRHRLLVVQFEDGDTVTHSMTLITTVRDGYTIRNSQVKAWHDVSLPVSDAVVAEVVRLAFEGERG